MLPRLSLFALALSLAACSSPEPPDGVPVLAAAAPAAVTPPDEFGDYWYQGLAEITSYDLEQARYGELHPGEAVLIYVTEPFLEDEQVKADDPNADGAATVLKLNATRTFNTGLYPYSMMTSVFAPVEGGPALKVTTSSQEWCGQTFTQLNRRDAGIHLQFYSYFEGEGDQDRMLSDVLLEDDLWTQLRLGPDALPTGDLTLVPGTVHQRFSHRDLAPESATATLADGDGGTRTYILTYPDLGRTLAITFSAAFPHTVETWTETDRAGSQTLTTTATRKAREMLPYWSMNSRADAPRREALRLNG
ncbi:MAG: septum formation inhibitor Maf [Bacteroidota bacterium]